MPGKPQQPQMVPPMVSPQQNQMTGQQNQQQGQFLSGPPMQNNNMMTLPYSGQNQMPPQMTSPVQNLSGTQFK